MSEKKSRDEKGKAVARGEDMVITSDDLTPYSNGNYIRKCPNCGSTVDSNFDYCPHCGRKL